MKLPTTQRQMCVHSCLQSQLLAPQNPLQDYKASPGVNLPGAMQQGHFEAAQTSYLTILRNMAEFCSLWATGEQQLKITVTKAAWKEEESNHSPYQGAGEG